MGEAKRRKAEIEMLKRASLEEADRWRQTKVDKSLLTHGIDPESGSPEPAAAMARLLSSMFEQAKKNGDVDPPITYLYSMVNATTEGLKDIPVACKKGCSHCCHIWVSASPPEILFISKIISSKSSSLIQRIRDTNTATREWDFDERSSHPRACPLLENDACSIYEARPKACRLAASANRDICARSYLNFSNEDIPTPAMYMSARGNYSMALAIALRKAGLDYYAYEFNEALVRTLDVQDAEKRWLGGEDIFLGVRRDPLDMMSEPSAQFLYQHAFG